MAKLLSPIPEKDLAKPNYGFIGSLLRSIGIDTSNKKSPKPRPTPTPMTLNVSQELVDTYNRMAGSQMYQAAPTSTPTPTAIPTPTQAPVLGAMSAPTPTQVAGMSEDQFHALLEVMANKSREKGFHPAIPVSQMAAESKRGTSRRAIDDNNLFGLAVYNDDAPGLKFNTPEESMDYYLNLISTDPRYAEAYQQRANPEAYIDALLRVPYATDKNYKPMITDTHEYYQYLNQ